MKAWQFTNTGEPLVLAEVEEPRAATGEVVIDVKAAGLCHSDVGLMEDEGWLALVDHRPITIGHEVAGVISEVGDSVVGWQVGDRVGVCPSTPTHPGYSRNGGYSFRTSARQEDIVRIPDSVSFEQAAAGTDAGMTSYHAVVVAGGVEAGEKVGIIGLGGLGQIGARIAVLSGADVHVADIDRRVWPMAEVIGAVDVAEDICEFDGVRFDLIVDFAGVGTTTASAVDVIRPGGRVVLVGMGKLRSTIDTKSLILNECRLIGSKGGDVDDVRGVYEFFASGRLDPEITAIGFEDIPAGLDRLRRGEVVGRLVARIAD